MGVYSKEDIIRIVREEEIEFVRLQFTDIFGMLKNVAITASQIEKAVSNQCMFDGSSIEGFVRIDESDQYLYPDLKSFRIFPWRPSHGKVARLICDVYNTDGTPFVGDPRYVLKRVIQKANDMGYDRFNVGPEAEFFLFKTDEEGKPTTQTNDEAGYFDLGPLDHGESTRREICMALEQMGFEIEASHHECAQGQHEIDFKYAEALHAADNIMTFKLAVKTLAQRNGLHATFMPKPIFGVAGSGMHTNMSLFRDGKNVFYDPDGPRGLSKEAYSFIAGLLHHVRGMAAVTNPLVNSYKRLVPATRPPATWPGLPPTAPPSSASPPAGAGTRVELRSPDPSCNPYLALRCLPGRRPGRHREGHDAPGGDHREHLRHGRRRPEGPRHRESARLPGGGPPRPGGRPVDSGHPGGARGRQLPDGQVAGVGRVPYPRVLLGAGEVHHQLLRPRGDGGRRL